MATVEPMKTLRFKLSGPGSKERDESGRCCQTFVDEIDTGIKPYGGGAKFTSADTVEIHFQEKFTEEVNKIIDSAREQQHVTLSDATLG